jgi:hypothetical protein
MFVPWCKTAGGSSFLQDRADIYEDLLADRTATHLSLQPRYIQKLTHKQTLYSTVHKLRAICIRHAPFNKSLNAVKQYGESTTLDYKQYRKHQPCTINVERKDIRVLVGFGRAKRPCPAYTRLFILLKRKTEKIREFSVGWLPNDIQYKYKESLSLLLCQNKEKSRFHSTSSKPHLQQISR